MRVECESCGCLMGDREAVGCFQYVLRLALAEVLLMPLLVFANYAAKHRSVPAALDLVAILLVLIAAPCLLFWVFCPGYFAKLKYRKKRCPKCGQNQWSWGFSEGWGL